MSRTTQLHGVEVRHDELRGHHLVVCTTESLLAGTHVLQEEPLALGCPPLYSTWRRYCHHCLKPVSTITCQDCKAAHWCSSRCQAADQQTHVRCGECALYSQPDVCAALGNWCREVSVVLRCLAQPPSAPPLLSHAHHVLPALKQCHGEGWVSKVLDLLCLLSMPAAEKVSPAPDQEASRTETQQAEQRVLAQAEDWRQVVIDSLCAVVINAIEVQPLHLGPGSTGTPAVLPHDQYPDAAAGTAQQPSDQLLQLQAAPPVALFRTFSRLNHSCRPNAVFHVVPGQPAPRVQVHLIQPVRPGEEVTVTYIDLLTPRHVRQQDLTDKYAFTCTCPRCSGVNSTQVAVDVSNPFPLPATLITAPGTEQGSASVQDASFSHPDWFLSHISSSTGSQGSQEADTNTLETQLQELHTQTLEMVQGSPHRVWHVTWPQLTHLWSSGVHPWQHTSLTLLSLVAAACTAAASGDAASPPAGDTPLMDASALPMSLSAGSGEADGVARTLTRATLCYLIICCALEQLLDAGETGVVLHAVHVYSELATCLCLLIRFVLSSASLSITPESKLWLVIEELSGADLALELCAALRVSPPEAAGSSLAPVRIASMHALQHSTVQATCAASLSAACRLLQLANQAAVDSVMFLPFTLNLPYAHAAQLVAHCKQGLKGLL